MNGVVRSKASEGCCLALLMFAGRGFEGIARRVHLDESRLSTAYDLAVNSQMMEGAWVSRRVEVIVACMSAEAALQTLSSLGWKC